MGPIAAIVLVLVATSVVSNRGAADASPAPDRLAVQIEADVGGDEAARGPPAGRPRHGSSGGAHA